MKIKYSKVPKLLIISYNSLLSSNSNGRTMINLISSYPKDKIAQFYMSNDFPDYENCCKYYRITDMDVFKSTFLLKEVGQEVNPKIKENLENGKVYSEILKKRKNQMIRFFRQKMWDISFWKDEKFNHFIESFSPDVILLQSGNNAFIDKIAIDISKKRNIPVILFNFEDYYFHNLKKKTIFSLINKRYNDKQFRKTMKYVSGVIYNTEKIRNTYAEEFGEHKSIVIMQAASEESVRAKEEYKDKVCYLGNLSLSRHKSIIEIAKELIKYNIQIDIFSNCTDEKIIDELKTCKNVNYKGFVDYNECKIITKSCKLLICCESFDVQNINQLKHAFSTKISDSLASGVPVLMYAPKGIAATDYLKENNIAFVASSKDELEETIKQSIFDDEMRNTIVNNAKKIAEENHNIARNSEKFLNYIVENTN